MIPAPDAGLTAAAALLWGSVRVLALLEHAPDAGKEWVSGAGAERDEAGVSGKAIGE